MALVKIVDSSLNGSLWRKTVLILLVVVLAVLA